MANVPEKFLQFNESQTKRVSIVVQIEGLDTFLSSSTVFTRIRYGDPGLEYGDPGIVYGGLRPLTDGNGNASFKNILSLEKSSLSLSQRIEPEQGRGSVSTLGLSFIDKDQFMTQLISPGVILDDILGKRVKVWLGYEDISFPEDYFVVFRGVISQVQAFPGLITFQISDANLKRRQKLFFTGSTSLAENIDDSVTTIPVVANGDFHRQIIGPDGGYDPAIKTYLKINDEFIEYPAAGFGVNEFTGVTRGARGSTPASHTAGDDVQCAIQIEDHAIDMALKLMLSGWNGPWISEVPVTNLVRTGDPLIGDQADAAVFPVDMGEEYGVVPGDYFYFTNASDPLNDITARVVAMDSLFGQPNRLLTFDTDFASVEVDTTARVAIRSKYDTYPETCGLKITPDQVDIEGQENLKNTFLISEENRLRFFIQDDEPQGKEFIERDIYLPIACYSLTRFGRLSVGLTKPPIADERLIVLDKTNVKDPASIAPLRAMNNRAFFNEIQFYWDQNDEGTYTRAIKFLDTDSLNIIGVSSALPIESRGSRTDLGSDSQFERRAQFLLSRYKNGAEQLQLKVNFAVANQVEPGDVVALVDNGFFQISDTSRGARDIGTKLFEVYERTLNFATGDGSIRLMANVGGEFTDRYGTISPSSDTGNGSTANSLKIVDSYGALYPGNESRKWVDYLGLPIMVHNEDFTDVRECTLVSIDPADRYRLIVNGLTGGLIPSGYTIDIIDYPLSPNRNYASSYKTIHAFWDPQVEVVTGASLNTFQVPSGDIEKFFVPTVVMLHNEDYSYMSEENRVASVNLTAYTVTCENDFEYVPTGGEFCEFIGFYPDRSGPYRLI